MSLRGYLLALIAAAVLPVALFGTIVGVLLVEEQHDTFRRGAQERALAMLTAVDATLRESLTAAQALAAAPTLEEPDFARFRTLAERILKTQRYWTNVNVALPSGQQVLNLRLPPGAPLPHIGRLDSGFARALQTREPAIGDLILGPVTQEWDLAVRVPVLLAGEVAYVVSAVVDPDAIGDILQAQRFPPGWVGVVLDRKDRIVARTIEPAKTRGQLASESLRVALTREPSGWFRGSTIEGAEVYTPYHRSPDTGFAFAMGIPAAAVDATARRAAWLIGLGLLGALALAAVLALLIARRISRPVSLLAEGIEAVGRGEPPPAGGPARVTELRQLAGALSAAAEALRDRQLLLRRERDALQAADRAKDEFVAMLSHELRNPLAALTVAAEVQRMAAPLAGPAEHAREVIGRQTRHMARLVEDLLDVSRVTMGKVALNEEPLDLGALTSGVIASWRAAGRFAGHRVSLEALPVWVRGDRTRLEQVLANLVDNALKFTPPGGRIAIAVRREDNEAVLEVADEGEGIAPQALERIFGLFVQGNQSLERAKGGLGIGLALVRRLAEMHGGRVAAHSAGTGKGARFVLRLPAIAAATGAAEPPPSWTGVAVNAAAAASKRILVVEDNDDARAMLCSALALAGHEVRAASDGTAALAAATEMQAEIALVDIGLPDMDGYELARRLHAALQHGIRLIALTGYGQPDDVRRAIEAGYDAHLTKPVALDALERAIAGAR
jgi:signal transduction histidine kinase